MTALMNSRRSITGSPGGTACEGVGTGGARVPESRPETSRMPAHCWIQIFQPLIHSRSLEPAGFMAVLVETTSMGLMVTKS